MVYAYAETIVVWLWKASVTTMVFSLLYIADMNVVSHRIHVSESLGDVSALHTDPERAWCIMTLAHGAGAGMEHSFMSTLARDLAHHGVSTLRFNFPFVEAKKKRPDVAPVAERTVASALQFAKGLKPALPLFASGKSFGGRMSSQYLAKDTDPAVKGIVFFGFPLHAAGQPGVTRAEHLQAVKRPMLFLQGTRDALAAPALISEVCAALPLAKLQTFEGADHAFMRGKTSYVTQLAEAAAQWLKSQCAPQP